MAYLNLGLIALSPSYNERVLGHLLAQLGEHETLGLQDVSFGLRRVQRTEK